MCTCLCDETNITTQYLDALWLPLINMARKLQCFIVFLFVVVAESVLPMTRAKFELTVDERDKTGNSVTRRREDRGGSGDNVRLILQEIKQVKKQLKSIKYSCQYRQKQLMNSCKQSTIGNNMGRLLIYLS